MSVMMDSDYSDIIDHPAHVSKTRPRMPMSKRAAQFAPFRALTGYGDKVEETARYTEQWIPPDTDRLEEIDGLLRLIRFRLDQGEEAWASLRYFVPDERKAGGAYRETAGFVMKIDSLKKVMLMEDGTEVPFDRIVKIKAERGGAAADEQ